MANVKKTDLNSLMKGAQRSQGVERPGASPLDNTSVSVSNNTDTQKSEEPRLNVALPQSLHKRLKVFCVQNDRQMREVVERAVLEYLSRQD